MCALTWFLQNVDVWAELASDLSRLLFQKSSRVISEKESNPSKEPLIRRRRRGGESRGSNFNSLLLHFQSRTLLTSSHFAFFPPRFSFWRLQKKGGKKKAGGRCSALPRLLILGGHMTRPPPLWPHREYNQGVYVAVKQIEAEDVFFPLPGRWEEQHLQQEVAASQKKKKSASDRLKCWIITWPSILAAFQIYIPAASETLRGNVCLGDFLRRMLLRLVKKKKKSAKNPPKKQETVTGNRWTSRKLFRPERKDGLHCFFVFSNLE